MLIIFTVWTCNLHIFLIGAIKETITNYMMHLKEKYSSLERYILEHLLYYFNAGQ
jgi:hypothetical protein